MNPTYDYSLADNGRIPCSKASLIKDDSTVIGGGALVLPRYSKLDGRYNNASNLQAYISSQVSNSDGEFTGETYPTICAVFSHPKNCSGLRLRFNSHTKDHPTDGIVRWYSSKGVMISEKEIEVTGIDLYLYVEILNFTTVEIVFYSTNKPYRPVFVEHLGFISLRAGETLKIIYGGRAPGAADNISIESESTWEELTEETYITIAEGNNLPLCTARYSKLDGKTLNWDGTSPLCGWVSKEYSREDGFFEDAPILNISFADGYYTSTGVNLGSGWKTADIVSEVHIQWLRDGEEISSGDFYPDSMRYFCANAVDDYNGLILTFKATKSPYRPVILTLLELGMEETFTADQITNNETLSEISQLSEELSNNSLSFSLKGVSTLRLQKTQELSVWFDGERQGVFYIKTGTQSSFIDYDVYAEDAISLLDESWYGLLSGAERGAWFDERLEDMVGYILQGADVSYSVDASVADANVRGYLPICTRREALQQVAFATGAIVDTFGSNVIRIIARGTAKEPVIIKNDNILSLSEESLDDVSKIVLTAHDFVTDPNEVELFNALLDDGTHEVTFSEPSMVTRAVNASEKYEGITANMVTVTPVDPTQNVVLIGHKRVDNQIKVECANSKMPYAKRNQNVIKIESAYFVHAGNAAEILERVYQYYLKRKKVTAEVVGIDVQPGDVVSLPLYDGSIYTGMVERVTSTYSSKAYKEVVVR